MLSGKRKYPTILEIQRLKYTQDVEKRCALHVSPCLHWVCGILHICR